MLLNAEIKDDAYSDLPRQQEAQYAYPSTTYLKSDAATGQKYVDLNAAAKSYSGAWLFGKQQVAVVVDRMRAQWVQWCPIPAGIADGVLLKGNVIYQNPNKSYRRSNDEYEGVIRTENGERCFVGRTQHTFYGQNFPGGSLKVIADLNIPLTERLAYNPMVVMPSTQIARAQQYNNQPKNGPYYGSNYGYEGNNSPGNSYQPNQAEPGAYPTQTASYSQEPDSGF